MITNIATPFARSACFEPAYLGGTSALFSPDPLPAYQSHYNVVNNDRTCGFDTAYGNGIRNAVNPLKTTPFDARGSRWRRSNSVIVGYAPRDYRAPDGSTCPQQPYYVVDETDTVKVVCPVLTGETVRSQCANCLTTVFQCEKFKEVDPEAYRKCEEYKRTLHYGVITPNGYQLPLAVEMDGPGMEVFQAAVQKCGFLCGSCAVNYPAMNFAP